MDDVVTAVTTALTTGAASLVDAIGGFAPIILGVVGAGIALTFGIRWFRKLGRG